ncbi:Lysosomal alpha-mannosidase [Coccomyxa sp. Obi]|nr:Lysosomal alpha-mannosidase [Coccomyxa sp. Obi]
MNNSAFTTIAVVILLGMTTGCQAIQYNTSAGRVEGKLNVHLVPHTHDDAGWLRTFYEYYYGSRIYANRDDHVMAGVQFILDTVTVTLLQNPDRKFTFADMAFFMKWWDEQPDGIKKVVEQLVENGQLYFVNGGYVQHDEAAAHYVAMIEQTTLGHQFLNRTFGFTPTIGWQIDPFGHSGTQASLMSGALGFDGLFFARTDYQDRAQRAPEKKLELIWRGAKSFGSSADVFTGNFPMGDYNPPDGFMLEWGFDDWQNRPSIVDCQDGCGEYNLDQRLDQFVLECQKRFNVTYGNDIMLTMGTDFTYANAFIWYKNMDKLIHYANLDGRLNVFYSTPAAYTEAKHSYNHSWPLKTDDYFPYADNEWSYWTGYFTSRPTSKGYVRTCTSFLQAARQLEVLGPAARRARQAGQPVVQLINGATSNFVLDVAAAPSTSVSDTWPSEGPPMSTKRLEMAVALLQHHDAITGTAKQLVADDYHLRLSKGMDEAGDAFRKELASLAFAEEARSSQQAGLEHKWGLLQPNATLQNEDVDHAGGRLGLCHLLNASVCHPTVEMSRLGHSILVAMYNPLGWPRTQGIRVPIDTNFTSNWTVTDASGQVVESQLLPVSNSTVDLQNIMLQADILGNLTAAASYELVFIAAAPPLGYTTYTLTPVWGAQLSGAPVTGLAAASRSRSWLNGTRLEDNTTETQPLVQLSSGVIDVSVSAATGRLLSLGRRGANLAADLNTEVFWYNSSDGQGHEASGAYIFRPDGSIGITAPIPIEIVEGPVLTEIRQEFRPWAKLTTRIWKGAEFLEVEWTAGPLPFKDGMGHELVIRYESNVTSGDEFYTDSNGREMLKRKVNFRPTWNLDVKQPVAGNYYPLTAAIYIEEEAGRQLAVVTDRAQGGSSLKPGQVEIMVHRRVFHDDARGVAENLNETMCGCTQCNCPGLVTRGSHYLTLQGPSTAASYRRTLQQLVNDPLILTFGKASGAGAAQTLPSSGMHTTFLADEAGLPKSVHLLTLKDNGDGRVLLRLAHVYQVDEDSGEDKNLTLDLNTLFKDLSFEAAEEVTLAAGKPLSQVDRLQWQVGESLSNDTSTAPVTNFVKRTGLSCQTGCQDALQIELQPMEIRTFLLVPASAPSNSLN